MRDILLSHVANIALESPFLNLKYSLNLEKDQAVQISQVTAREFPSDFKCILNGKQIPEVLALPGCVSYFSIKITIIPPLPEPRIPG